MKSSRRIVFALATFAAVILLIVFVTSARATDLPAPLSTGTIHAKIQIPAANPDADRTLSVGLRRADNGELVLCLLAANGDIVEGDTDPIQNLGSPVLLEGFSYSEPDCAGNVSSASSDRYRVVFSGPDPPLLLIVQ